RAPPEGHEQDAHENEDAAGPGPGRQARVAEGAAPQERQERVENRKGADDGDGKPGNQPLGSEERERADDGEVGERRRGTRGPPRGDAAFKERRGREQDGGRDERLTPDVGDGGNARQVSLDDDRRKGGNDSAREHEEATRGERARHRAGSRQGG